jgi:hypothetical protein
LVRRISRGETPRARHSSRSVSTVGGVLVMSTRRNVSLRRVRKSTDFRQVDQVGFW